MKCRHLVGRGSWYEGLDYLQREKHQTLHFALSPSYIAVLQTLSFYSGESSLHVQWVPRPADWPTDSTGKRPPSPPSDFLQPLHGRIFPESPLLCRIMRSLIFRARASLRKSLNMREAKSFLGVYTYKLNSLCNWEFMGGHISIKAPIERS